jgi:hypothetical protein
MQTLKQTQITVMDLPVVELEGVVFKFVRKYSAFLHDEKGNPKYMKVPLDKASIEKMIKEAKNELTDSEIRDILELILELIHLLFNKDATKKEIWFEVAHDCKNKFILTKTRIAPTKNPIMKVDETVFEFIASHSTFLYDDIGHMKYIKLSPDEVDFSEMIDRDAKIALKKTKINNLLEVVSEIKKYRVKMKEDLWFKIV